MDHIRTNSNTKKYYRDKNKQGPKANFLTFQTKQKNVNRIKAKSGLFIGTKKILFKYRIYSLI
jgi:hypothetical protein